MARNRKRADGRYQASFRFEGKRVYVYGTTQAAAESAKEAKKKELASKSYRKNQAVTISEYIDEITESKKGSVKQSSVHADSVRIKHIKDDLGKIRVAKLERRQVSAFRQRLIDKKLSASTVNRILAILKSLMRHAVIDEIVEKNCCEGVPYMKSEKKPARETVHRALTDTELKTFFDYCGNSIYYNLFRLLLNTGLRVGEGAALTWEDIDEIQNCIHVTKTVATIDKGRAIISTPKTKTSKRDIPLNADIKAILAKQKEQRFAFAGSEALKAGSRVFTTINGNLITASKVDASIREMLHCIQTIEPFSVHAFRDTFATRCIQQGMQPNTLKTILGHASLAMTMDLYAHCMNEQQQEEMQKIKIKIA